MSQISNDLLTAFKRDSFVVINRLVAPAEVTSLHAILMDLYQRRVGFKEGAMFDATGSNEGADERFLQILQPRWLAPKLAKSAYHTVGLAVAKQILGESARLRDDILFLKPPHVGGPTPWHQDIAYCDPSYDHDQITIWLALTPADATNSCMSFMPGSNEWPILSHRPLGDDPKVHALECCDDFDPNSAIECPLAPGDCTIHGLRTLHYAGANTSDRYRLAYALIFDTKPVLRKEPYYYPWKQYRLMTARAQREQRWRRRGGFVIHAWRQRHRLYSDRGLVDVRSMFKTFINNIVGRGN
jgi:ectoine hydroxylase-related dioxygenase (phytanoyl-CoA dioxygenase family)